ncbi:DinB family protein [Candidatus Thorarchaeota archaeon]|nr:MAG: DinB family protein [Candidatus Thorarchaeota archaeon]
MELWKYMQEEWFRTMLAEAHRNQRNHLERMIAGLTDEHIMKKVIPNEEQSSIFVLLEHIASSETYWFYRSKHGIGSRPETSKPAEILEKLKENSEKILDVLQRCSKEQLRIIPPSPAEGPSVAWALLRTYMHGIYHSGQIAKFRYLAGAPPLPEEDIDNWARAVDSVAAIVDGFIDQIG